LGPEKIVSVITDLGLKAKAKISIPRPQTNIEEAVKDTTEAIDKLIKSNNINIKDVRLIGIGASGVVDITSGTIHDTDPNRGRTRTNIFSFAKSLENKFKIQALVGNDATCAAFGELNLNQGSEISNMLFIYSDVGCGIIINGDIYCGSSGAAGEIQLLLNGKPEKYTLDEEAAYGIRGVDLGITDKAKELIADEKNSLIAKLSKNDKNKITKELILQAAKEKDKFAVKLIVDAAHWLGIKVAYLINIFNPQIVAIGGGMEKGGEAFFNPLIACIKIHAFEECFNAVKILPSYLGEDAVSLGAAALSVRELFLNA